MLPLTRCFKGVTMNNAIMLEATELDMLNGGSWGYNTYHNEKAYKDAGYIRRAKKDAGAFKRGQPASKKGLVKLSRFNV